MTKVLANWMANAPKRIPIYGVFVKAEPLDVGKHVDKLYELHSAPENRERFAGLLWKPPKSKEEFEESLRKMIDNEKYEASLNYVYIHLGKNSPSI